MPNIFLVSDTHFSHEGVCKFLRNDGSKLRPWNTAAEMDEELVKRWNSVVKPNDKVYHLGDVVIKKPALAIMDRLNGSKRLIRGNHDIFSTKYYLRYFKEVYGVRVLEDMILSHIPLHPESVTKRYKTNVHGHLHANDLGSPVHLCVCVEQTDFTPISIEEVRKKIRERNPN